MIYYIALLVTFNVSYICYKEYKSWKYAKELW